MKSKVKEWVLELVDREETTCISPMFAQTSLYWNGFVRSISWIVCEAGNGPPPDHIMVPIRSCDVKRCGCKYHYRWGTPSELRFYSNSGKDNSGANNPNSKLSWDAVAEIRGAGLVVPRMTFNAEINPASKDADGTLDRIAEYNRQLLEVVEKRELMAIKYRITLATLDKVLKGYVWKEINRPAEADREGDEF